MKILFSFFLLQVCIVVTVKSQKKFSINGNAKFYNNKYLYVSGGIDFQDSTDIMFYETVYDSVRGNIVRFKVENDSFNINGILKYPHPFSISFYDEKNNTGYGSKPFFLDNGDSIYLQIKNLAVGQNKDLYKSILTKANKENIDIQNLISKHEGDQKATISILKSYIQKHTDSYVAFWILYMQYNSRTEFTSKVEIDSILELFSDKIKNLVTYKTLKNIYLKKDLSLEDGQLIPNFHLDSTTKLYSILEKHKYTLIDFWFCHCQPCIEQFSTLKRIYEKFSSHNFEMIGISIDHDDNIPIWKKTIIDNKLNWLHYLDPENKNSDLLNVSAYPTNFLLDDNGKIIERNIPLDKLNTFLSENL